MSAKDEDAALDKIRHELQQPYGFIGRWETVATEAEVIGVETNVPIGGTSPEGGPLLLSIKDAAKHLGISTSTMYELVTRGEIEHVELGRRRLISRAALDSFIVANSRAGRRG